MEIYRNNIYVILDKIATRRGPIPNVPVVIRFLKTHGKLSDEKAFRISELCNVCSGEKDKLKVFIIALYRENSLRFFLYVLELINLSDLADEIVRPVSVQRPVRRANLEYSKHLQKYFFDLKTRVDTSAPVDRETFLEEERNRLLEAGLPNNENRNKSAHELAVVTWLQIQHCRRDTETIRNLLQEMKENWPPEADNTFCDIIFHSKMGIAYVLDDDIESASEHYRIARHLSTAFHEPLTKFFVSHDRRYTNQRIYELNRSDGSLRSVLVETEIGLCFLESDNNGCEEFIRLTKRMFFLYLAMFHLKIHTDFRIDFDSEILDSDLHVSKNVVDIFESSLCQNEVLDPRRNMIYIMCRARLCQLQRHLRLAEHLLSLAFKLREKGAHDQHEVDNILRFLNRFKPCRETVYAPT